MYHEKKEAIPLDLLKIENINDDQKESFQKLFLLESFTKAKTFHDQVKIACKVLRDESEPKISYANLGIFFNRAPGTIQKHHMRSKKTTLSPGRPPILPMECLNTIKQIIYENFNQRKPVTYDYLIDEIQKQYKIVVKPDTLRHICRGIPDIKSVRGEPMEKERVNSSREDILNYYTELEAVIEDVPGGFIFNVDESGCSDWCDAQEMRVLVPSSYEENSIKIPIDRNSKRATLVGCISADGKCMKPLILLPRKTIEEDIRLCGYNDDNALFAYQKNAFMTTVLFDFWAENVFFPELTRKRKEKEYVGPAILIMDGLGAHYSQTFIEECNLNGVYIIFLPPHTSDQCQPLDLVTFALLKRNYNKLTFNKLKSMQSNF